MEHARRPVALLASAVALATASALMMPLSAAATPQGPVVGNETKPIYSHAEAVKETVYIESKIDSDSDGKLDRIAADVMRPKETNSGLKVPIVMEASPYYQLAPLLTRDRIDRQIPRLPKDFRRWYDEFFVPRGYAVVEVEMQGTARSDGCPTTGGKEDTRSIAASIDWLNGRAKAVYADGTPAVASWSTGAVGMLGGSYNGTLPTAVAATGIKGLKTIVPMSAISSWYDYTRDQGIGYSNGWDERYAEWLASYVASPAARERCKEQLKALGDNSGDDTFNYTPFWRERDYKPDVDNIRASVFVVHGQEDWNVKPAHYSKLWDLLAKNHIPRKLWLLRGGHIDPNGVRQAEWQAAMHRWMDHWLYGLDNGVMKEPIADIQRPDGKWETQTSWPDKKAEDTRLFFGPAANGVAGTLGSLPSWPTGTQSFTDDPAQTEANAIGGPEAAKANRLAYLTPELKQPARISGTSEVTVRVTPETTSTPLTALLVDYGSVSDPAFSPVVVTRGAIDVKNHLSLSWEHDLKPGQSYYVRWKLHPKDHIFAAGHRIGLVVVANNASYVSVDPKAGKNSISLLTSHVELPVVGGRKALGF
ncbi:Xaa-Pro dipeptidyl-peptidase [Crossiella sp. SN42]|uniref:Xaa-Pro dipeptidyl-peptidase n=1 Tax=Crossiella sp. SN42 TaxID=2944808 RepID=UPI00207C7E90|nr:Xaa-Pro dipeptidyl-peptidase [Crossiella sp. SN42]MCO1576604.1 Xaa-Pro dipeptidyl-peptidase [Crossiella sp. SN42]